jgi:hypothetical protein
MTLHNTMNPDLLKLNNEELSLSRQIDDIIYNRNKEPEIKLKEILSILSEYKADQLPSPRELALSEETWLQIYWTKVGKERGRSVSQKERSWDTPIKAKETQRRYDALTSHVEELSNSRCWEDDLSNQVADMAKDPLKEPAIKLQEILSWIICPPSRLPSPRHFELSKETWLHIYWTKLGQERGKALTTEEELQNIPLELMNAQVASDPLSEHVKTLRPST